MPVRIKSTAVAYGKGTKPRAGDLKEFVNQIPDEAKVNFEVQYDQKDGDSWTLTAEWEGQGSHKPGLSYPPGVRGTTGKVAPGSQFAGTDGYYSE